MNTLNGATSRIILIFWRKPSTCRRQSPHVPRVIVALKNQLAVGRGLVSPPCGFNWFFNTNLRDKPILKIRMYLNLKIRLLAPIFIKFLFLNVGGNSFLRIWHCGDLRQISKSSTLCFFSRISLFLLFSFISVLRIRDVYPGSELSLSRIPDPHQRI